MAYRFARGKNATALNGKRIIVNPIEGGIINEATEERNTVPDQGVEGSVKEG